MSNTVKNLHNYTNRHTEDMENLNETNSTDPKSHAINPQPNQPTERFVRHFGTAVNDFEE